MNIPAPTPSPGPGAGARLVARLVGAALCGLLVFLQACGGSASDVTAPPPGAKLPELSGHVTNGSTATNVGGLQITVKGHVGTARTAEGRLAPIDGTDYLASLDQLSGPYLLSDSAASSSFGLYAVAAGPGTANLTPLTTLLVAELLGTEPGPYFAALGTRGGFTAADGASIAAAEQRVRRLLKRDFGFDIPSTVGPFVTSRFSRTAGDPMFDTINALVARLGTNGDYSAVVSAVAQESARCRVERVRVDAGGVNDDFCPFAKSNALDGNDTSVRVLGFGNRRGDALRIRLRGTVVIEVRLTTAEGVTSSCTESACAGVGVGTPAGDRTQLVSLTGTSLRNAGGFLALNGTLRTAVPGIELPGLPCTTNRFYLIDEVARAAQGYCATPDDFGLGASGQSLASGSTRRSYTFGDGAGGPAMEVVVQGSSVVSALVYSTDPATGTATAGFQCRGALCVGLTLGTITVDESLGVPIVLQPIRFDRVVMPAVLPDGSLSTTASATVEATFTGFFINDASVLPLLPVSCAAGSSAVTAVLSERPDPPVTLCEPEDPQGFQLRSTATDENDDLVSNLSQLVSDGAGSASTGSSVTVTYTAAGVVRAVAFDQFNGPRYRCAGAACTGISVSVAHTSGERTVSFGDVTLTELGTAGLTADRTVRLTGSFVAPVAP